MKNKILKEHFLNPRNMGNIENPDYRTVVRSETCNDIVRMMAVVKGENIEDIKTEVFGCGYSIAGASMVTELAIGKKVDDVSEIIESKILSIIDDVPEKHRHCINLSKKAFENIYKQLNGEE